MKLNNGQWQLQQWEIDLGITVINSNETHREYYLQMARAYGIKWNNDKFMNHDIEYWKERYIHDKHLNNHPLSDFDSYHYRDRMTAQRLPGKTHLSLSMTVCMRKSVIIQKVIEYMKGENNNG